MGLIHEQIAKLPNSDDLPDVDEIDAALGRGKGDPARVAVERYRVARQFLIAFNSEPEEELADSEIHRVRQLAQNLVGQVTEYSRWMPSNPERAFQALSRLGDLSTEITATVRPLVRGGSVSWADELDYAREARIAASEAQADAERLAEELRDLAERAGTGALARAYSTEAESHSRSMQRWLFAVAALGLLLTAGGYWAIATIPHTGDWRQYVASAGTKAIVIAATTFGLAFCARNYRVHVHLRAVYRQRAAAIDTYNLLARSMHTDDPSRSLVLGKLAESIFAISDTGVHRGQGDTTVIETNLPWIATPPAAGRS
ncbi:hypothetical protein ACNI3K_06835 [Demequina sp. SO4-13]|uniref:hypothetical protein n=1 Tax=Demequina sp. SO4-13 TaxID=3401027 RepID=UPI003AF67DD6